MKKCIVVAVLVAFLTVTGLSLAKGPGVVASGKKAQNLAGAKCRSRDILAITGEYLVRCTEYGADFCHIPRYDRQQVFCVGYFWIFRRYENRKYMWEFCTRSMYFRRSRYGTPKLTKPYYSWDCIDPGYGPPNA